MEMWTSLQFRKTGLTITLQLTGKSLPKLPLSPTITMTGQAQEVGGKLQGLPWLEQLLILLFTLRPQIQESVVQVGIRILIRTQELLHDSAGMVLLGM